MPVFEISVPGRTEVAGNHQDHQAGCVIAAAVDRRITCTAEADGGSVIAVESDWGPAFALDLAERDFADARPDERNTTAALVRGMAAGLVRAGVRVGGCRLAFASDIPVGMGLSSSAAFELCAGAAMMSVACGPGGGAGVPDVQPMDLARMALTAERDYFGKPSGILDQTACALGGVNHLDFADVRHPVATPVELPESWSAYTNILVDCGSGHESTTGDFALVAHDMRDAAEALGLAHLGDIPRDEYLLAMPRVQEALGDRAALRALHFYNERDLVERRRSALADGDMREFVRLTELSGVSSAEYLHNVSMPDRSQPAMVALALCRTVLEDLSRETGCPKGSARIHGGGFGGTIQVFVARERAADFEERIARLMGDGRCMRIALGGEGITVKRRA